MLALERVYRGTLGFAGGMILSVLYMEGAGVVSEALDQLRDGALLLLIISIALMFWHTKKPDQSSDS